MVFGSAPPKLKRDFLPYTTEMKFLLTLLLALALAGNAFANATAQANTCCASDECDVVQCLAMGCLPAASPIAAQRLSVFAALPALRDLPDQFGYYLPSRYKEIWTPPD